MIKCVIIIYNRIFYCNSEFYFNFSMDALTVELDMLDNMDTLLSNVDNSLKFKVSRLIKLKEYHGLKLYEPDTKHTVDVNKLFNNLNYNTNNNTNDNISTDNTDADNISSDNIDYYDMYIAKNDNNKVYYEKILNTVSTYKIKKSKKDEDTINKCHINIIYSKLNEEINTDNHTHISMLLCLALKEGILLGNDINKICYGNIFYKKKKHMEQLTITNSRCLIALDNKLKHIIKYLRDTFISPCFYPKEFNVDFDFKNTVDQSINTAKKVVKYDNTNLTFCFDTVSNIAIECMNEPCDKIQLDLSNAFNNVSYELIDTVLNEYLDAKLFKQLLTDNELQDLKLDTDLQMKLEYYKQNFISLFIYITSSIKYYDNNIINYLHQSNMLNTKTKFNKTIIDKLSVINRNKGLPQGCSFSTDVFIMCMDYIIKNVILRLENKYNIIYDSDYSIKCYVDDIMLFLKTESSKQQYNTIIQCFTDEFTKYKFAINSDKTLFSQSCTTYIDMEKYKDSIIKNNDKFLGIYYENDIVKYSELINLELKYKYHQDTRKHSLYNINNYIGELEATNNYTKLNLFLNKTKFKLQLEGKLRYRLSKFVNKLLDEPVNKQYTQLLINLNLEYIAKYLFN